MAPILTRRPARRQLHTSNPQPDTQAPLTLLVEGLSSRPVAMKVVWW
jgi:hypothetical protein